MALLQQVAKGDEFSFRLLYENWQGQLASYIFRITKSKEITAEIVQDVFLKIWISREALSEVDNFKSYLFIVSRNQAINALKKAMRELKKVRDWEKISKDETQSEDFENERFSLVDEAIEQLSPRQKEVFILHRYEKFTYQQIADKLGIGKESVKTHIGLAVKAITKYLKGHLLLIAFLAETILKYF